MPENDGKKLRKKAEDTLNRLDEITPRDNAVAATVAVGYALLAILDELHAIGERVKPTPKGGVGKVGDLGI